jgi:hypothetical protein
MALPKVYGKGGSKRIARGAPTTKGTTSKTGIPKGIKRGK